MNTLQTNRQKALRSMSVFMQETLTINACSLRSDCWSWRCYDN